MKRGIDVAVRGAVVLGLVIVATGWAQVYPMRWDDLRSEPKPAASPPPSLVLADGGIEFPDGSVQATAADARLLYRLGAPVPKTGQTTSYAIGDDGDLEKGVTWPNPRFTDNGDGTVTDNLTELIWLKDANCPKASRTWAMALSDVTQLNTDGTMNGLACGDTSNGGSHQADWRLPNILELHTLIDLRRYNPAVPSGIFSGVQSSYYWSSTTKPNDLGTTVGLGVYFRDGDVSNVVKSYWYYVWSVRGGQPKPVASTPPSLVLADGGIEFPDGSVQATAVDAGLLYRLGAPVPKTGQTTSYAIGDDGDLEKGVTWPNPRFTDNGDGTVTDNLTELIWLKDANCPKASRTWAMALSDVTQLNTDGTMNGLACGDTSNGGSHQTDWRLPNILELHSLIDFGHSGSPFSGIQQFYWSSTTNASLTSNAWIEFFYSGFINIRHKDNNFSVWSVRGGQ